MGKKILLLILLLISISSFAQSDQDIDQQKVSTLIYKKDLTKVQPFIDSKFLRSTSTSKKIIGYVYLSDYYSFFDDKEKEKVEALEKAKKLALATSNDVDMAYVHMGYARYYKKLGKNDLFIKSINKSIETFEKYPDENFILTQLYTLRFKYKAENPLEKDTRSDCLKANYYALKSKNNILINFTYNNLGYFYKKKYYDIDDKKYLDSAMISYQNSYKYIDLIKDNEARQRSLVVYYLNYGGIMSILNPNSYDTLLKQFNKILSISKNNNKFNEITSSTYNNIGSVYENINNMDSAKVYYLKAYHLSKDDDEVFIGNKLIIFNNLSRVYENSHQLEKALSFEREAKELIQKNSEKQFLNNTKSLEIFYQTEQKNQQIKDLRKRQQLYIVIIVLVVLGILLMIYIFSNKQKLNKQRTALLESEQKYLALQQQQLQKQAIATSLQLESKNNFINELKSKIKEKNDPSFEKILREEQLADNDFSGIQKIIQNIHPNFFKRLQDIAKIKLTNLDMKYAAYIYLNMDNQQIGNILKIDPNTVRVTKYRLKQKFGLKKEDDIHRFIQNIEL